MNPSPNSLINQKIVMICLSIIASISLSAQQSVELKRQKITKEISMEIPVGFTDMAQGERVDKYVSSKAPLAMFTSQDRLVDLGINENSSAWPGDDLEILQSLYKANISNLFTQVDFIQEEIKEIDGRKFIVFEFVSRITDEETTFGGNTSISKYTYIQYTLRNERVLLFNFSCPKRLRQQWQTTAKNMMESIRIKK